MINVILSGCNGKMGQVITRLAKQDGDINIVCGFDMNTESTSGYPVYNIPGVFTGSADVIIDFSHPSAFDKLLDFAIDRKIPVVMSTTGLSAIQISRLNQAAATIPVFFSANMSLGVNLLIDLVQKAAKVLEGGYDIEIIEKHHNQKVDAPSGTALMIADAMTEVLAEQKEYVFDRHSVRKKRGKNEIGIHAIRGGTIVGEHTVIFAGNDEVIELTHQASSKEVFAVGALKAACFLKAKPIGLYNMKDLVSEII